MVWVLRLVRARLFRAFSAGWRRLRIVGHSLARHERMIGLPAPAEAATDQTSRQHTAEPWLAPIALTSRGVEGESERPTCSTHRPAPAAGSFHSEVLRGGALRSRKRSFRDLLRPPARLDVLDAARGMCPPARIASCSMTSAWAQYDSISI